MCTELIAGQNESVVEHRHEVGTESMCVTDFKILLCTKEQAVKAGTAVSTSRQYIRRTNRGQEQSSIFMRVIKTRPHHPLSQPRAGRSGRLTSSADLVVIQHVISMRSIHPAPSWGHKQNPAVQSIRTRRSRCNASLSVSICLGCCVYRSILNLFLSSLIYGRARSCHQS